MVINAINGEILKTLIKGEDNVNFEELNILRPKPELVARRPERGVVNTFSGSKMT